MEVYVGDAFQVAVKLSTDDQAIPDAPVSVDVVPKGKFSTALSAISLMEFIMTLYNGMLNLNSILSISSMNNAAKLKPIPITTSN